MVTNTATKKTKAIDIQPILIGKYHNLNRNHCFCLSNAPATLLLQMIFHPLLSLLVTHDAPASGRAQRAIGFITFKLTAIILAMIGLVIFREWKYLSFAMWAVASLLLRRLKTPSFRLPDQVRHSLRRNDVFWSFARSSFIAVLKRHAYSFSLTFSSPSSTWISSTPAAKLFQKPC